MLTIITSPFGSVVIDNESYAVYTSEEVLYDECGNITTDEAPGVKMHVADLIFETESTRYIFPKLWLGVDYMLEIMDNLATFDEQYQERRVLDLKKLVTFIDPEMIGKNTIIVENKKRSC